VFADDLEPILGHAKAFDHLVVYDIGDGTAVFRGFALDEVDTS
jgi:hypothetical protein